jgi:hypothetical protein
MMNKQQSHRKFQLLFAIALVLATSLELTLISSSASAQNRDSADADNVFDIHALGISFIPNMGQTDSAVLYQVNGTAGELFFKSYSLIFALPVASQTGTEMTDYTAVELEFLGRNEATYLEALGALTGKVNYLRGTDLDAWLTNIPSYAGIAYRSLYEGIDLSYSGTEGQLKSTFTVARNVNPALIRWQYRGAERTWVDSSGNLMIQLIGGAILREQAPIAWQDINGEKQPVSVATALTLAAPDKMTFTDWMRIMQVMFSLLVKPHLQTFQVLLVWFFLHHKAVPMSLL